MFTIFKKKIFSHENTLIVQGFSHFWVDTHSDGVEKHREN